MVLRTLGKYATRRAKISRTAGWVVWMQRYTARGYMWQLGVCSGDQNTDTRRKTIAVHFQSTKDNRARQTVNARRICNLRRDRHFTFAVTTPLISVNPLLL